ncbi:MAG: FG-GAP-like repeat-containing protein [bacterium]|nr:FG-GAP-like repeat-containing protein [bacterium]
MRINNFTIFLLFLLTASDNYAKFTNWYNISGGMDASCAINLLNEDNYPDLILSGSVPGGPPNNSWILTNNRHGKLENYNSILLGGGSVVLFDYNNDNKAEMIQTGSDGGGTYFKSYTNSGSMIFNEYQDFNLSTYHDYLSYGDIDIDGDNDLILAGSGYFRSYTNYGKGHYGVYQNITPGVTSWPATTLGDIDNDGDLDLIMTGSDGSSQFKVYKNNGSGIFSFYQDIPPGITHGSIALGDIDADKYLDLVMTGEGYSRVYKNTGNGAFSLYQNLGLSILESSIALGDINSDGSLDLIITGSFSIQVLTNNGNGTYDLYQRLSRGISKSSVLLSDLDNDGDMDLITSGYTNSGATGTGLGQVFSNKCQILNLQPDIPSGMQAQDVNGYWKFIWNASADDHTVPALLNYKIAISTVSSNVFNYSSEMIDYPRGQANIGNVPQGWKGSACYYQSKIPVTTTAFWKVCALDTSFKDSGYCQVQKAEKLYSSRIIKLEPSSGIYFQSTGKIIGDAEKGCASVEVRIKNLKNNKYWNGNNWTESTNSWLNASGKEEWEYGCKSINWVLGEQHYAECRTVNSYGNRSQAGLKVEFIPVWSLSEQYSFCNYPNPFDPNKETTCIEYLLQNNDDVKIMIFDINGGVVRQWDYPGSSGNAKQGINRIYWDGKNVKNYIVANGVYFCYLKISSGKYLTKIIVLK